MTIKNIEQLKQALEKEHDLLVGELAGLGILNPVNNDWEATLENKEMEEESDENDKADQFEEFEERSSTLSVLEKRLQDIDAALTKISDGKYGMCETCGAPISTERLEANPAAKTCLMHINE